MKHFQICYCMIRTLIPCIYQVVRCGSTTYLKFFARTARNK